MFSFFRTAPKKLAYLSPLGVDFHNHLLPGVDDGAADDHTARQLLDGLLEMGFSQVTVSPHVMADLYPNRREDLRERFRNWSDDLQRTGWDRPLTLSAEYHLDENFRKLLERDQLLPFGHRNLLIELSFVGRPPDLEDRVFNLRTRDYRPILAHPERYSYFTRTSDDLLQISRMGCQLQVNLLSLLGYYGKAVRKIAYDLIGADLVDYLATDLHNLDQLACLRKGASDRKLQKILRSRTFKNQELIH